MNMSIEHHVRMEVKLMVKYDQLWKCLNEPNNVSLKYIVIGSLYIVSQ